MAIARDHPFTYLDAWVTDRVGHRADLSLATALVARVDAVVDALASALDGVTLVVVSDHGNLEDASAPRHTRARVPLRRDRSRRALVRRRARLARRAARAAARLGSGGHVGVTLGGADEPPAQNPNTISTTASYQAPKSSSSPAGTSSDAARRTASG